MRCKLTEDLPRHQDFIGLIVHNVAEVRRQRASLDLGSKALLTWPAAAAALVSWLWNNTWAEYIHTNS